MILIHDLSILVNTIFLGLSILMAIILWNQKTAYRSSNQMLALLLVAIALTTFNTIVRLSYYMEAMDFYQQISNAALLTMGPSVYLFIKMRVSSLSVSRAMLHYIPFFIYGTILIGLNVISEKHIIELIDNIAFLVFILQWVIYLMISYTLIHNYQKQARENFSNLEKHNIGWIKIVLTLLLLTLFFRLCLLAYSVLVQKVLDVIGLNLTLIFAAITCYLSYKIFKNPELFIKITNYSRSNLALEDLELTRQKIENVMTDQQLFINPKLSITEVADRVGVHSRIISQTINQQINQNFYDYINGHRVKYLMEKLKQPDSKQYTLQALMEESGFQSPSVAYTAFKKITGITPAKFRKANQ